MRLRVTRHEIAGHTTCQPLRVLEHGLVNRQFKLNEHGATGRKLFAESRFLITTFTAAWTVEVEWRRWKTGCSSWQYSVVEWWSCGKTAGSIYSSVSLSALFLFFVPLVFWHYWLGGRKGIRPVKNWVVGCWHGYLSGVRYRLAYGPADTTATHCLLL